MKKIREKIKYRMFRMKTKIMDEIKNEDGIGVVEVILILLVLVGLVIIFKSQITSIAKGIFSNISNQVNGI